MKVLSESINSSSTNSSGIDNNKSAKIMMADSIIEYFQPLFSEEIEEREKRYQQSVNDYKEVKEKAETSVSELKKCKSEMERQKLVYSTLQRLETLRKYDLLYGSNKRQALEILNSIYKSDTEELKKLDQRVQKIVEKSLKNLNKKD